MKKPRNRGFCFVVGYGYAARGLLFPSARTGMHYNKDFVPADVSLPILNQKGISGLVFFDDLLVELLTLIQHC